MASMSQCDYFPKITKDITEKLTTIFLNCKQIEAIQDQANHKLLKGPFGSGKTVILAEIAKKLLYKVFKNFKLLSLLILGSFFITNIH